MLKNIKERTKNPISILKDKMDNYNADKNEEKSKYEFLPSALEIAESPPSPLGSRIITGIFLMLLIAVIYASVSKVDMVAVARGKIIPGGRVKVIQVPQEGVITDIYVDEGDTVEEGQLLVKLDNTEEKVDEDIIKYNLNLAKAEKDLLEKYLEEKEITNLKQYIDTLKIEEEIKANIFKLILTKTQGYETKKNILELNVEQKQKEIEIAKSQLNKLKQQSEVLSQSKDKKKEIADQKTVGDNELLKIQENIKIAEDEEKIYKELYNAGAVAKKDYKEKQDKTVLLKKDYEVLKAKNKNEKDENYMSFKQVEGEETLTNAEIQKQQIAIQTYEVQLNQEKEKLTNLEEEENQTTISQILEKQKQIKEYETAMQKANQNLKYQNIASPVDGQVAELGVNTIGGVVTRSQSIMSIVPKDTQLIIEANVANKDIGFIYEGQEVSIKVDTFSFQKYGTINGTVEKISPDAYEDEKYGLVYKVKIRPEKTTMQVEGKEMNLSSGMGVTAEIKTGKRRVIDFLIEPLIKYTDEALKVR